MDWIPAKTITLIFQKPSIFLLFFLFSHQKPETLDYLITGILSRNLDQKHFNNLSTVIESSWGVVSVKKYVKRLVGLIIYLSVIVSVFVLYNYGERKILFEACKWVEGKVPEGYVNASTLPLENEIVSLVKTSVTSGAITISESSPIKDWAIETMENGFGSFGWIDIRISENEYYNIIVKYIR